MRRFDTLSATMFVELDFSAPLLTESMIKQNLDHEAEACRRLARNCRGRAEETFLLSAARTFAPLVAEPEGKD